MFRNTLTLRDVALLACYCSWIPILERAWSHLQDYYPVFPFPYLSDETEAEISAYRVADVVGPHGCASSC